VENQVDLMRKIERLQRDVFRMKCAGLLISLLLATGGIVYWMRIRSGRALGVVEASGFIVRDHNGRVVANLGQFPNSGTCLGLWTTDTEHGSGSAAQGSANLCAQYRGAFLNMQIEIPNSKGSSLLLTPGYGSGEPALPHPAQLAIIENGQKIGGFASHTAEKPNEINEKHRDE
jgi:hypothetical protein